MSYDPRISGTGGNVEGARSATLTTGAAKPLANSQGVKADGDKPDLSLIPDGAIEGIALAMMDGEKKYGRYNYKNGLTWSRLIAASMRHLRAFNKGEDCAQDSKLNHLYHAAANVCMLIEYYENKLGTDNRYKK